MRQWSWLLGLVAGIGTCLWARPVAAAPPAGYYLLWSDEFNAPDYDRKNWRVDKGARRDAINTPRAISCDGSNLVITTFTRSGIHYTGILDARDRVTLKYGYTEASIDFDDSPGMWSAFWMMSPTMGRYLGDPGYAGIEVDICEHRKADFNGVNIDGVVVANLHWDGYGESHKSTGSGNIGSGLGAGYHNYAVRWADTHYEFFIDGVQRWSTSMVVSHRSEYVLLSSEVLHNSWAGQVPGVGYGDLGTSATRMRVDYVRHYAPTNMVFWEGGVSGSWTEPGNWRAGMDPGPECEAVFSLFSTSNRTVTLDSDVAIRGLTMLETPGSIILQSNRLTLGSGGIDMVSAMYNLILRSEVELGDTQFWAVSTNHTIHVHGPVNGSGRLVLRGYGKVVMHGPNTYTNGTVISRGTLRVANTNGSATGTGAVTVLQGTTLTGAGAISGSVELRGEIAPGDGIGVLTTGGQTWKAGGSFTWEINNATNSGGWDGLVINGGLNVASTPEAKFKVKLVSLNGAGAPGLVQAFDNQSNYTWSVATASDGIASFDPAAIDLDTTAFANPLAGGVFTFQQEGNSVVVKFHSASGPPLFVGVRSGTNGELVLDAMGFPGRTYTLQSASALDVPVSWSFATNVTTDTLGRLKVTEAIEQAGNARKFYRLSGP